MTSNHSGLPSIRGSFRPGPHNLPQRADRILHRGDHLFRTGDSLNRAYLVVAGILKSYILHEDGSEQILDFPLPGDVVGVDALVGQPAGCLVMALDTSSVCELTLPEADDANGSERANAALALQGMYQAVQRLHVRLHMASATTEQRLARYLLDFANAQGLRGCSSRQFRLPMRRRDLACYLGLATETLSRTIARLQQQGLLEIDSYEVTLLDEAGLRRVASISPVVDGNTTHRCNRR